MSYQDKLKPITSPVTQSGYASKLRPIESATAPIQPKQDGFLKTLVKDPIKTLLVKPAARVTEAAGRGGLFGKNIKRGFESIADSGEGQRIFGMDIEPVKAFGQGGGKQIAGEALQSLSYLYGGGAAKKGAQTIGAAARGAAVPTAARAASQTAKVGAISGAAYGAGEQMTQKESTLGSILAGGAFGGALGGVTGGALGAATPAIVKTLSPAQRAIQRGTDVKDALRRITPITKKSDPVKDAAMQSRVLRDLDLGDARTNSEIAQVASEQGEVIQSLKKEILRKGTQRKTIPEFSQKIGNDGKMFNHVDDSLNQLEKNFAKNNEYDDVAKIIAMRKKALTDGLTADEIDDIAIMLGRQVFNPLTGETATGVTKIAMNNTRRNLKNISRNLLGDDLLDSADKAILRDADAALADLNKFVAVRKQRANAVENLKSSLAERSFNQKLTGLMEQALNIVTAGRSRQISEVLTRGANAGKPNRLNVLDKEKMLVNDIRLIKEASKKGATEETIVNRLQQLIRNNGEKPVLLLEAPKSSSNTLFGTQKGTITSSAQEASDMAAVEAGKTRTTQMDGRTYRRKMTEIQDRLEEYLTPAEMDIIEMGTGRPATRGPQLPTAQGAPDVFVNPANLDAALQRKLERYLSPEEMAVIQMGPPPRPAAFDGPTIQF